MLMGKYVDGVNLKLGLGVALVYNSHLYMIRFNLLRRFTPRIGTNLKPRLQRFASSYDADIAGLTEEEAEVTPQLISGILTKLGIQFRDAVAQFAEKEVSPRAAEIDKSNNFPSVR